MSTDGGAEFFGADWVPPQESESVSVPPPPAPDQPLSLWGRIKRALAPLAAFLAAVVKLKSVLFLGSMFVSIAAYAQLWGWRYGVGFVLLLLVHELGHVVALRLRGIRASGLVFVPFIAALTMWEPKERRPYQEAETALAGPIAGTAAALAALWYAESSGSSLWRALAFTGLLLNLFNLIPFIPLDGGRVARLTYPWVWAVIGLGLIGYLSVRPKPLVVILFLLVCYELYLHIRHPERAEHEAVEPRQRQLLSVTYVALVVVIVIGMHATYTARTLS